MAKMLRNRKVEAVLRPQQKPYDARLLIIVLYTAVVHDGYGQEPIIERSVQL